MAKDEVLTENEDDIEIVEVDAPPGEEAKVVEAEKAKAPDADTDEDDQDDADGDEDDADKEDSRLSERDTDPDEDNPKREKRINRRRQQKEARDRTLAQLELLRRENQELKQRIGAVETTQHSATESQIEARLAEIRRDIETADQIMAQAITDQNGENFAAAQRIRDEARDRERELQAAQQAIKSRTTTEADPRQTTLVSQWKAANPWYGAPGYETQTAIANTIDVQVAAAGFDKGSPEYYRELSRRINAMTTKDDGERRERRKEKDVDRDDPPRRRALPLGANRDGNGQAGRRQVHLSKERVDAIKAAGAWDDPQLRAEYIREYEKYDRENSAAAR